MPKVVIDVIIKTALETIFIIGDIGYTIMILYFLCQDVKKTASAIRNAIIKLKNK